MSRSPTDEVVLRAISRGIAKQACTRSPFNASGEALDFFLWGYLKDKIYARQPTSPEALKGDLVQACLAIPRDMVRRTTSSVGDRLI